MASNVIIYALTQKGYDDGTAEAAGGTLLGVPVSLLDARPASQQVGAVGELGLQVEDGDEWVAAGHPKAGPAITRLRAALDAQPTKYTMGPRISAGKKTLEQLKAAAGVAGLELYAKAVEEAK